MERKKNTKESKIKREKGPRERNMMGQERFFLASSRGCGQRGEKHGEGPGFIFNAKLQAYLVFFSFKNSLLTS